MPIYDRRCLNCKHLETDLYEKVNDVGAKECAECGKVELQRLPSAPHIDSRSLNITNHWIEKENEKCLASGGKVHEPIRL